MPEEFGNPWMTNLVQPLPPEAVPWWPPAPGWYVLMVLIIVGLLWMGWRVVRRWRANAYRREAARLVDCVADRGTLDELPEIVKRAALLAFPRSEVASLSGDEWLGFLDGTLGSTGFTTGSGRLFADLAFSRDGGSGLTQEESQTLINLAKRWVNGHRREKVSVDRPSTLHSSARGGVR